MQGNRPLSKEEYHTILTQIANDSYLNALYAEASGILEKFSKYYLCNGELKQGFVNSEIESTYNNIMKFIDLRTAYHYKPMTV